MSSDEDETIEHMVQGMHISVESPTIVKKSLDSVESPIVKPKSLSAVPETSDYKINCLEQELKQERELNQSFKETNQILKKELEGAKDRIRRLEAQVEMLEKMALL